MNRFRDIAWLVLAICGAGAIGATAIAVAPTSAPVDRPASHQEGDAARTARALLAAFNAHDADAMGRLVAEDVAWLSVAGEQVAVEARSKTELVASMRDYFAGCPTCRSRFAGLVETPSRVSAIEVAEWQGKDGPRSQRSLSVYEVAGGLVVRVYYFPVER